MPEEHNYNQFITGLQANEFLVPRNNKGYSLDLKIGKFCQQGGMCYFNLPIFLNIWYLVISNHKNHSLLFLFLSDILLTFLQKLTIQNSRKPFQNYNKHWQPQSCYIETF